MNEKLTTLKLELLNELENNILSYWIKNTVDHKNGGFIGTIEYPNKPVENAPKGSVLNARILWTFSAAYMALGKKEYADMAHHAYEYFVNHFIDKKFGGIYWELDYKGNPLNKRKQIYGISFAIYGLSEYYRAFKHQPALDSAIELYRCIEKYSLDKKLNGYFEALNEDWSPMTDYRLSPKDANESKTMNTHLHILEAYTNLYRVWKTDELKKSLANLIELHLDKFIDRKSAHLNLFFDDNWNLKSDEISFGHDIECSWLLFEAAEVLGDHRLLMHSAITAYNMANATFSGIDSDYGIIYELFPHKDLVDTDKHWWPQAEAMVGFYNAWQISGNDDFLHKTLNIWEFTKKHIVDHEHGEWFWKVNKERKPYLSEVKVGFWKCPYHNSRACFELINRINNSHSNN